MYVNQPLGLRLWVWGSGGGGGGGGEIFNMYAFGVRLRYANLSNIMLGIHSQKRHRLDASCGFYRPDASCIKPVDFIKLHQVCEHQTCCNLIFADLLQVDETTCIKRACSSQLAASLLTTCNRLVIIKLEQAMRTRPDIGLVIADLLQLARFWLCIKFIV